MAIKKTYIYANSQVLAQHNGSYNAPRYFYLHDRLGSIRLVINSAGDVNNTYTYTPFGEMFATEFAETIDNNFKFTGQFFDEETGQYHLRARQYEPPLMRFTSIDPVDGKFEESLSLHKYLYCQNDPINRIDPAGLDAYLFFDPTGGPRIYPEAGHISVGVDDVSKEYPNRVIVQSAAWGRLGNTVTGYPGEPYTTTSFEEAMQTFTSESCMYIRFKKKDSSRYAGSNSDYLIWMYLKLGYHPSLPYCSTYSKAALAYGEYDMGAGARATPTALMSAAIDRAIEGDSNIEVSKNALEWYLSEEDWLSRSSRSLYDAFAYGL